MANPLQFDDRFKNLANYLQWTDAKINDLVLAVDVLNINSIQSHVEAQLRALGFPKTLHQWISANVLHIRQSLDNLHKALCALTLSELSLTVDRWHKRLWESQQLEWRSPLLCCGPGAVEDSVLSADAFIKRLALFMVVKQHREKIVSVLVSGELQPTDEEHPDVGLLLRMMRDNPTYFAASRVAASQDVMILAATLWSELHHSIPVEPGQQIIASAVLALPQPVETDDVESVVRHEGDVLTALHAAAIQPGRGLKPFLGNPELSQTFIGLFDDFVSAASTEIGGAQAFMASGNSHLGIKADIAWPYHPRQLLKYGTLTPWNRINRVVMDESYQLHVLPFSSREAGRPHKRSFIVALSTGHVIAGVEAAGNDRLIFRMRRYSSEKEPLHEFHLICHQGQTIHKPGTWYPNEWPSLPLLGQLKVGQGKAIFQAANATFLQKVAGQYPRLVWSGLQAIEDPGYTTQERALLVKEITYQMEVLCQAGVKIFIELSGVPRDVTLIRDLIAGRATFVSINQTELDHWTNSWEVKEALHLQAWPVPTGRPESLLERHQRGVYLAQFLNTDVFVHGNECSFYITRAADKKRLQCIVLAILAAKLAVIAQLLERTNTRQIQRPDLADKGFMALLQFAYDFAQSRDMPEALFEIMNNGYYAAATENEYSFVIVPVPWPEEVHDVNPTGSGDTIAGVAAALLPD